MRVSDPNTRRNIAVHQYTFGHTKFRHVDLEIVTGRDRCAGQGVRAARPRHLVSDKSTQGSQDGDQFVLYCRAMQAFSFAFAVALELTGTLNRPHPSLPLVLPH